MRRALAVAVPILALNSIFTAFADNMPASHHVAALIAVPIFAAVWIIELSGVRWPRGLLIATVVIANLWLTVIGHTETNLLFLPLMVGWVAFVGTPVEGLVALVLAFVTITIGQLGIVAPNIGGIPWESWTEWSFVLVLTWFLGFSLRKQERLVTELDHRGQELQQRGQELEQRGQELEMLLTVSGSVASTLDMRQLLEAVFDALGRVLDYSAIAMLTLNESRDTLTVAARRGPTPHAAQEPQPARYSVVDLGGVWDRLSQDEPIVIADVRGGTPEAATLRHSLGDQILTAGEDFIRTLMLVPLVARGQIIGVLAVTNGLPSAFGARETSLSLGIARQAAVAIENARLHERAQQAAVMEERQRLSRELHDSVTQALYGISLYAEAAGRALTDGEIQPVATNLQEIRDTTQEALGEMRLLLFELRPPLLQERGLAAALRARLQGVETRAGLLTQFDCQSEERLSPEKEQELYRVAQEALNNVLKHAHAGRVDVNLSVANGDATLDVVDDGVGFEQSLGGGFGLGLRGMHERVERLGGTLRIDTSPGAGTHVRVDVPR
ncbi:MAG: GAF domain-containing protein [Chloroflexi bacterium]|nr:GAF domain-containing protein [Chloroflexota bacterium]MBV9599591.1 GAF domain-containing protein [Chloroflexota bacterium]